MVLGVVGICGHEKNGYKWGCEVILSSPVCVCVCVCIGRGGTKGSPGSFLITLGGQVLVCDVSPHWLFPPLRGEWSPKAQKAASDSSED